MARMQRRDFVKGLAMASAAATQALGQQQPSAPPPTAPPQAATIGVTPTTSPVQASLKRAFDFKTTSIPTSVPDIFANTHAHFFNEEQLAALRKLSGLLMPALGGYPGATEAGVPEFIDFLIGVSPSERQHMYQSGLDHLNLEAKKQFGMAFAKTSPVQADKLIRPGLVAWVIDHPPTELFPRFIALAHRDIRAATMNSQAWSAAATAAGERATGVNLYWSPIDPHIETNL